MMEAQRQAGLPKRMRKGLCGLFLRVDLFGLLLFRADLLGPVELQNRRHANFPYSLLGASLLVRLFAAAQLAFDGQMSTLRERLRVLGQAERNSSSEREKERSSLRRLLPCKS
jgi:hypothetical protein